MNSLESNPTDKICKLKLKEVQSTTRGKTLEQANFFRHLKQIVVTTSHHKSAEESNSRVAENSR